MTAKPRKSAAKKAPAGQVKVELAYPWNGHDPDSTVTVDATTARDLIRDGRARPATTITEPKE